MRARAFPILAAVLLATGACASGGMSSTGGSANIITAEDVMASGAQTAYDAVQRLRPAWLNTRGAGTGGPADVYMGGVNMGGPSYLQSVLASNVKQLRYYDAGEAGTRFGTGHQSGVIELTLK